MLFKIEIKKEINWIDEQKQYANETYTKKYYLFNLIPIFSYNFKNEHINMNGEIKKVGFQNS